MTTIDQGEDTPGLEPFLRELSFLCREHGFGIEGGTIYILEPDDCRDLRYGTDEVSDLYRIS